MCRLICYCIHIIRCILRKDKTFYEISEVLRFIIPMFLRFLPFFINDCSFMMRFQAAIRLSADDFPAPPIHISMESYYDVAVGTYERI